MVQLQSSAWLKLRFLLSPLLRIQVSVKIVHHIPTNILQSPPITQHAFKLTRHPSRLLPHHPLHARNKCDVLLRMCVYPRQPSILTARGDVLRAGLGAKGGRGVFGGEEAGGVEFGIAGVEEEWKWLLAG